MAVDESDLIEEDGTGVTDANTYITYAAILEYHRLRGNELWAEASEDDRVSAMIRAADYIDTRWNFIGTSLTDTQGLYWPVESYVYDKNGNDVGETVPQEIEDAACEYALQVLGDGTANQPLYSTPDQSDPRSITMEREVVGPIESEVRYDAGQGITVTKSYPAADSIIKRSGYLASGGSGGAIR